MYSTNDITVDCGQDGYCWNFDAPDQGAPQHATDIWGALLFEYDEDSSETYQGDRNILSK